VEQRFAAEKAEVADIALVQNRQGASEVVDVNPAQLPR
jgi:hypothetical protein